MKTVLSFFLMILVFGTPGLYASQICIDALKNNIKLDDLLELIKSSEAEAINFKDHAGETPLIIAVRDGRLEVVKKILKHPKLENVGEINIVGESALAIAMKDNRKDIARLILEHLGTDLGVVRTVAGEFTPLHFAVYKDEAGFVELILEYVDMDAFNVENPYGFKVMGFAKVHSSKKIINMLKDFKRQNRKGFFENLVQSLKNLK